MKLNLLPKTINEGNRSKTAWILGSFFFILCAVGSAALVMLSSQRLERAQKANEAAKPAAENAVQVAQVADTMMGQPAVKALVVNNALAEAMIKHNEVYPKLYNDVKPYIPAFFRLTSMSATPGDANSCTLNLTGTIKTYQQYADLMMALMRIPGAQSVSRGGFVSDDIMVPPVTAIDQNGRPKRAGEAPIPDDPLERLAYFEQRVPPSGYLNVGNFGAFQADGPDQKGAMPQWSLINVSVVLQRNIQTPNPRATIATVGSAPAPVAAPGAVAAPGGAPIGAPGGAPTPAPGAEDVQDQSERGR